MDNILDQNQCQDFKNLFLGFLKRNHKFTKIKKELSQAYGVEESFFNSYKSSTINKLIDQEIKELKKKAGIILNGETGCGKKALVKSFANSYGFELEQIDVGMYKSLREVMKKYSIALHMKDVKINLI